MVLLTGGDALAVLLVLGGSILAGYAGQVVLRRYRVSDVLFLLLVGVALGPVLRLVDAGVLAAAIPVLAPLGLMVALFEGGLSLAWDDVRRFAAPAAVMTLSGWALTAGALALVADFAFGMPPHLALLFGFAVCATGSLGALPLLSTIDAPKEARVVLTFEAAVGSILSSVAVVSIAAMYLHGGTVWEGAFVLISKSLVGASVGVLAGILWARALHALSSERHGYALTLAALVTSYVAAETLGGAGLLAALVFGIFIGNAPALVSRGGLRALSPLPPQMRLHQSELIFILRSVYFVFLGLLVSPAVLSWGAALAAVALVAALVAARIVAVSAAHPWAEDGDAAAHVLLVSMSPRGLTAAILATLPASMGVPGTEAFATYAFLVILGAAIVTSFGLRLYAARRSVLERRERPVEAARTPERSAP